MAHPRMFDDLDPLLDRVRRLASSYPDCAEKVSHGRPAFYTKKVFAYYGGSVKDESGWTEHAQSVMFLADRDERPALVGDVRFYVPAYLGPYGWLGIDLNQDSDWTEISELVEVSYRLTAPKASIVRLDASFER